MSRNFLTAGSRRVPPEVRETGRSKVPHASQASTASLRESRLRQLPAPSPTPLFPPHPHQSFFSSLFLLTSFSSSIHNYSFNFYRCFKTLRANGLNKCAAYKNNHTAINNSFTRKNFTFFPGLKRLLLPL